MQNWQADTSTPLVSICCIAYNHEFFIDDALKGFLIQETDFPFEILIHDDASTDKTAKIIRNYEKKYPNIIKPIYQKINQFSIGKKASFLNLKRAKGKYIALCEGDDYWTDPQKISYQTQFLEKNHSYSLVFHNANIIFHNKSLTPKRFFKYKKNKKFLSKNVPLLKIPTQSVLFQNCFNKLNSKIIKVLKGDIFIINGDVFLWATLAQFGKFYYINKISSCYRVHPNGLCSGGHFMNNYINSINTRIVMLSIFDNKLNQNLRIRINRVYAGISLCFLKEYRIKLFLKYYYRFMINCIAKGDIIFITKFHFKLIRKILKKRSY